MVASIFIDTPATLQVPCNEFQGDTVRSIARPHLEYFGKPSSRSPGFEDLNVCLPPAGHQTVKGRRFPFPQFFRLLFFIFSPDI